MPCVHVLLVTLSAPGIDVSLWRTQCLIAQSCRHPPGLLQTITSISDLTDSTQNGRRSWLLDKLIRTFIFSHNHVRNWKCGNLDIFRRYWCRVRYVCLCLSEGFVASFSIKTIFINNLYEIIMLPAVEPRWTDTLAAAARHVRGYGGNPVILLQPGRCV